MWYHVTLIWEFSALSPGRSTCKEGTGNQCKARGFCNAHNQSPRRCGLAGISVQRTISAEIIPTNLKIYELNHWDNHGQITHMGCRTLTLCWEGDEKAKAPVINGKTADPA
ncbi:hypothetical protein AG1IA_04472 [Rhizoctonia solani AG-1 IA]|uniref:Uncharacterized protein n=1 Tax=Thanatephorus cucumeris (strain AG1-IA) TaxID=983506 RepID=L8WYQ6_THACA|nr:hypothetical protein AG1IA_04472 [Rhizoctonia solani AG-1 IA]